MEFSDRQKKLESRFESMDLSTAVIVNPNNIYYLTGFASEGSGRILLWKRGEGFRLYVPRLEFVAASETSECSVQSVAKYDEVYSIINSSVGNMTGIEKYAITLEQVEKIRGKNFADIGDTLLELRRTKSDTEVQFIRRAVKICERGMRAAIESVKVGITETALAATAEEVMRRVGSEGPAFTTIVASGPNAAKPHHSASGRRVEREDTIVLDMGATYKGYRSDVTRTVLLNPEKKEVLASFEAVLEAQLAASGMLKEGVEYRMVDSKARDLLRERGYGEEFNHSLGHGIGLDIHERPFIGPTSQSYAKKGDVVTIEPGVYINGRFGIRIEDDYLVDGGGVQLTTLEKHLVL